MHGKHSNIPKIAYCIEMDMNLFHPISEFRTNATQRKRMKWNNLFFLLVLSQNAWISLYPIFSQKSRKLSHRNAIRVLWFSSNIQQIFDGLSIIFQSLSSLFSYDFNFLEKKKTANPKNSFDFSVFCFLFYYFVIDFYRYNLLESVNFTNYRSNHNNRCSAREADFFYIFCCNRKKSIKSMSIYCDHIEWWRQKRVMVINDA